MEKQAMDELNANIKALTKAVRVLTAVLKRDGNNLPQEKAAEKSEKDMCSAEEFVRQVYSEVYAIETIKEAMQKRGILTPDGRINGAYPQAGLWRVKEDGTIIGDPDAINNLILDMLAED